MVHEIVAIEYGVHRADGWQVRKGELLRSFSRILGAPQPGYSRFNRTIVASIGGGNRLAWR